MAEKEAASAGRNGNLPVMAGIFVGAFVMAFALAWLVFSPSGRVAPDSGAAVVPAEARRLAADDLRDFFRAVERKDFGAMRDIGEDLFTEGAVIPDSRNLLAEYVTNSFPPHLVYAFYTHTGEDAVYRVLLTTDENDAVVSYMAEAMPLAR